MPLNGTLPSDLAQRLANLGEVIGITSGDVEFAYLFGSVAVGRQTPRSDIDLAIYVSEHADGQALRLAVGRAAAKHLSTDAVDVVLLNAAPIALAGRVLTSRRVVLDRMPFARHRYESTTARNVPGLPDPGTSVAHAAVRAWLIAICREIDMSKRRTLLCLGVGLALAACAEPVRAQQGRNPPANVAEAELHVLPVQGNVYMLVGPGGNITIQTGKDGALLVDTMFEPLAPRIATEVRKLTNLPIRYIIDTSIDADHINGNAALAALGATGASPAAGGGATVIANEHVLNRLAPPVTTNRTPPLLRGLPNDEYFMPTKDFYFNGEPVIVIHAPNAHTDGDSMVLFRRSDVLSTGDIFTPDRYPVIDIEKGGSVQGLIAALNHVLDITVPERLQEGGTRVIPGHGRLCNEADVVEYRDMVTIVRDRIRDMVKKGMSLEQVKAARPTLDYDTRYGSGEAFIESVYTSLRGK